MVDHSSEICYFDNCPICEASLTDSSKKVRGYITIECPNECYSYFYRRYSVGQMRHVFWIYGERFAYASNGDNKRDIEEIVKIKIDYWKENDRYVMKMLEGE